MRILVVGAGATGGYFGGRLAQAGRDVSFLVRAGRAAQLQADGLRLVSPHGDLALAPAILTADALAGAGAPFDVVLLAVKAFALDAALADLAPAVGPQTMIVPLLNGIRHLERIEARFGAGPLLGGVCRIATMVDAQGRIVQLSRLQDLVYGELGGARSVRVERLHAVLSGAGFEASLSTTIAQDMWDKWVMLAALGGITCLMRGSIGEVEAAPGGTAFAAAFLAECAAVAQASGQEPGDATLVSIAAMLQAKGSPMTSSMYRDLQAGAVVEADQILGDLLARATRLGLATPLLGLAVTQLAVYQRRTG